MSDERNLGVLAVKRDMTEIEKLIKKIKGVISSKIITNSKGQIEEVHVLANIERTPKQIVRDVQSSITAAFEIHLDHKLISVAQVNDEVMMPSGIRLLINNIQVFTEGNKLAVKVFLSHNGQVFEGSASGVNSSFGRAQTVVYAILSAVHIFLSDECVFSLIDVQSIKIANKNAYIVAIGCITEAGEEILTGSSIERHDEYHAVMRATLDAINRRMSIITGADLKE